MSVSTEGMGGGGDDPDDRRDDVMRKVIEHATAKGKKRKRVKGNAVTNQPPAKKQRQSVITNYFARPGQAPPAQADFEYVSDETLAADMPVTVPDGIEIDGEESEYGAKDTNTRDDVASLTLYWAEASETYWVNHIEVDEGYRRRGIATAMLRRACDEHGTIYFSLQTADDDDGEDTRHLTDEGFALATAASGDARLNCVMSLPGDVGVRVDEDEDSTDEDEHEHAEEDPPPDENSD